MYIHCTQACACAYSYLTGRADLGAAEAVEPTGNQPLGSTAYSDFSTFFTSLNAMEHLNMDDFLIIKSSFECELNFVTWMGLKLCRVADACAGLPKLGLPATRYYG